MTDVLSIAKTARLLRSNQTCPVELVDACLKQIERLDAQLRAWIHVDVAGARASAQRLRDELSAGRDRGPLHGIPIGVKDIIDVEGMPTRAGSALTDDAAAAADAPSVSRLRESGAIILGKTVTTEFACFDPPPTRNPWNLDRTPGGSSSGSAVAVAARMCFAALGTQTGGSITRPASYCGLASCKPTFGRLSMQGIVPVSHRLDHLGPIGPTVGDVAIVFATLSGQPAFDTVECIDDMASPHFGLPRGYFLDKADANMVQATQTALAVLEAHGAVVSEIELPASFNQVHLMHRQIMAADAAAFHREQFESNPEQFGPQIRKLLDEGLTIDSNQYQAAIDHQRQFCQDMEPIFSDVDILITPATTSTAPSLETTGDAAFNSPWSYAGLPTVSTACAVADDGLPAALQLIGRQHDETRLLTAAIWCEQHLEFDLVPPAI